MRSQREVIRTIGHGTRTTDDLATVLRSAGVAQVIDVRRYPVGRRQPHFAAERLAVDLPARGIAYETWADELGGRRDKPPKSFVAHWRTPGFAAYEAYMTQTKFKAALAEVERRADTGEAIALMCAETLWWQCHRRLIADRLVHDGFAVRHLMFSAPGWVHLWPQHYTATDAVHGHGKYLNQS